MRDVTSVVLCVLHGLYRFVSDTILFIREPSSHFTRNLYENRLSAMFAAASKLLDFDGRVTPIQLFYFNTTQHVQLYNLMYYMN